MSLLSSRVVYNIMRQYFRWENFTALSSGRLYYVGSGEVIEYRKKKAIKSNSRSKHLSTPFFKMG